MASNHWINLYQLFMAREPEPLVPNQEYIAPCRGVYANSVLLDLTAGIFAECVQGPFSKKADAFYKAASELRDQMTEAKSESSTEPGKSGTEPNRKALSKVRRTYKSLDGAYQELCKLGWQAQLAWRNVQDCFEKLEAEISQS